MKSLVLTVIIHIIDIIIKQDGRIYRCSCEPESERELFGSDLSRYIILFSNNMVTFNCAKETFLFLKFLERGTENPTRA